MARTDMEDKSSNYIPVPFKDVNKKYKPWSPMRKYVPDTCVEYYEKGLPLPKPTLGQKIVGEFNV
jgi:hypothetical protein